MNRLCPLIADDPREGAIVQLCRAACAWDNKRLRTVCGLILKKPFVKVSDRVWGFSKINLQTARSLFDKISSKTLDFEGHPKAQFWLKSNISVGHRRVCSDCFHTHRRLSWGVPGLFVRKGFSIKALSGKMIMIIHLRTVHLDLGGKFHHTVPGMITL